MAQKTQSAQILKVALPSALRHGQDMVGVPEGLAREPFESPFREKPEPVCPSRAPQLCISSAGIDTADRANAVVPQQNLLAQITRVGAEAPFVHAPIRTERETPCRDFQGAPAAER